MIGQRIWILLLLLLAAGTGWVVRHVTTPSVGKSVTSAESPDYYLEQFEMTTLDEYGRPKRRLEAQYMEHDPNTLIKALHQPYLIMYQSTSPPWHIRSSEARLSADNEIIDLLGQVQIWREGTSGTRDLEIETEDLTVHTKTYYGETSKPAVIRTLQSESRGTGMQAYLDESRLILQSQVRTRYEALRP